MAESTWSVTVGDSKRTQWFQCPLCVDIKSVNKATIGNNLVLDNYVNTAISNIRILKRVPKDSRVRIAIGFRLGSKICDRHECVCGKNATEDDWHGLSCLKRAGRLSRHSNLNALIKQSLTSTNIPSVLEPRDLCRTDQNRADGLTLVPWAVGKQFLWDVTAVDSLAPCKINAGSLCKPVTVVKSKKNDKYKDDGYLFQPLAFEIQGAAGPSTEIFFEQAL